MDISRRASASLMALGALVAWADIDSDRIAATTFGLVVAAASAVIFAASQLLSRRPTMAESPEQPRLT